MCGLVCYNLSSDYCLIILMSKEKPYTNLYCPDLLSTYLNTLRAELLPTFYRFRQEPLSSLENHKTTLASMETFCREFNRTGLSGIIQYNLKDRTNDIPGQFSIKAFKKPDNVSHITLNRNTEGKFYIDGLCGFALDYKDKIKDLRLRLAVTSFVSYPHLYNYSSKTWSALSQEYSNPPYFPIILQLQSIAHYTYPNLELKNQALSVINNLRWEFILVSTVIHWAESVGMPVVFGLPAQLNRYVHDHRLPPDRGKLRYDVTFRRCSFQKKTGDGELYVFNTL